MPMIDIFHYFIFFFFKPIHLINEQNIQMIIFEYEFTLQF